MKLLGIDTNAKTVKGQEQGWITAILYLAPERQSGIMNVCPSASAGCAAACLYSAGHGRFDNVKNSRIEKTRYLHNDRAGFMAQLRKEITAFEKYAAKKNLMPCVRLNGTSDLRWESAAFTRNLMQDFAHIQFYDYTKRFERALKWARGEMPDNYHLTFSWNEENHDDAKEIAKAGGNIAVVFSKPNFPDTFLDLPVVNGDANDLRFLDPKGCIVGLKAKGEAKKDKTGFVVQL